MRTLSASSLLLLACACTGGGDLPPTAEGDADTDADADADTDTDADADTDADTDTDVPIQVAFVVYPSQALVPVGEAVQLRSRSVWSDGTTDNTSNSTAWAMPATTTGTLGADGLFTAAQAGTVQIDGTFGGDTVQTHVVVHDPADGIASIEIQPADLSAGEGSEVFFSALATLDSGETGDIGANCTWEASDPSVAVAGASGVISTLSAGTTPIRAICGTEDPVSTDLTVAGPPPRPDLRVTSLQTVSLAPDAFRLVATIDNLGGYSGPFPVDFTADAATEPGGQGDVRIAAIGVGDGNTAQVVADFVYTGPRPVTLTSWAVVDADLALQDLDRTNNAASIPTVLEADVMADVEVVHDGITVFGPTDAGVIYTVTNHGPAPLTDLVVYFERDAPTATAITDVEAVTADASETIPSLASGESYTWIFTYDQVPFGSPWTACGYVFDDGFTDPDLSNNLGCGVFPAY